MKIVAVVALSCMAGDARAQPIFVNYTWNNPSGGSYHMGSNWTPSSGFGGIPDSDNEGAVFNLDAGYFVTLTSDISTNSALVRDGTVALALGTAANPGTYTLSSLTVEPTASGGDPRLIVGDGTLRAKTIRVADGGQLTLDTDVLQFDNGTVTGAGSTWSQTTGFLRVGDDGTGTLLVADGGTVENADGAAIGRFAGSNGTATVTGDGSTFDVSANISVGQEGTGTLIVEDGGSVSSTTGRVAATSSDAVGNVTITGDGSSWTMSDFLRVGESGEGTLLIEAGGNVFNDGGSIGTNAGSTGTVTITGAGSTWNVSSLSVGSSGNGALTIENGGTVASGSNTTVGSSGHGMLTISDGGSLSSGNSNIGLQSGSTGTATVTGAGSTWTTSFLGIGGFGEGTLTIADGGSVSSNSGSIGPNSGGEVAVTGADSNWTNSAGLTIGSRDTGTLRIADGGSVSNTSGFIGRNTGSTGTVTVAGTGSTWMMNGRLSIGGDFESGNGGTGTLHIDPSATVDVAEDTVLFPDGLLRLHAGTLATTGISFEGGGEFEWTDGTLHVGQFNGDLTNPNGGTLAPGRSAGATTITGDYTHQAAATLEIEIGGLASATEHDHITVGGNLLLGGGELRLTLLDGFVPNVLHTFTILEFDGDIFGQFDNVAGGERLDTADGLGSFVVHYGPTSIFNPNQIVLTSFEAADPPELPGDYNQNGVVDAADYTVWRDNLGAPAGTLPNDTDGGPIGQAQYQTWVANFGEAATAAANPHSAIRNPQFTAAVPEPSTLCLTLITLALCVVRTCWLQGSRTNRAIETGS